MDNTSQEVRPKSYVGFIRDHSGSMRSIVSAAANDYNTFVRATREAAINEGIDTIVSTLECGVGHSGSYRWDSQLSSIAVLSEMDQRAYHANGGATPLWDSVGAMIEHFKSVPDLNEPGVAVLIVVTTDGGDNSSRKWTGSTIAKELQALRASDRWTVVFRVPKSDVAYLRRMGIPEGNIQGWETSSQGMQKSTQQTVAATTAYFSNRSRGINSTDTFYVDVGAVTAESLKNVNLVDVSKEITVLEVNQDCQIRPFLEGATGKAMVKGVGFYQLTKTERAVQDYKMIAVRKVATGEVFVGDAARSILGLPFGGTVKITPGGSNSDYEIYIQSTSVNRKLLANTKALYFPNYQNYL